MRLISLSLRNFKKHVALDVNFTEGVNGVFGPNYRGKSSLLHGIIFCLGGASALPRGMSVENDSMGKSDKFRQSMVFGDSKQKYLVVRTKTEAKLYNGDTEDKEKILATGTVAVNQRIESILGTDIKTFKSLRYAEQKKTDAILTLGVSKLHAIVDQITGVDDVNDALTKLSAIQQMSSARVEASPFIPVDDLQQQLVPVVCELGNLEKTLAEAQHAEAMAKAEVQLTAEAAEKAAVRHNKAVSVLSAAEGAAAQASQAEAAVEVLTAEHQQACEARAAAESALTTLLTEADLPAELDLASHRDQLSEEAKQAAGAGAVKAALEKDLTRQQALLDQRNAELEAATAAVPGFDQGRHEELLKEFQAAKDAHTAVALRLKSLKQAIEAGTCDKCRRPFDDCGDSVAEQQIELADLVQEEQRLAAAVEACRVTAGKSVDAKAAHEKAEQRVLAATKAVHDAAGAVHDTEGRLAGMVEPRPVAEIQAELDKVNEQIFQIRSAEATLSQASTALARVWDRLGVAKANLDAVAGPSLEQLEELRADAADASECRVAADAASRAAVEAWDAANKSLAAVQARVTELTQQAAALNTQLASAEENNLRREAAEKELNTAKGLAKFLRDNRDRYIAVTWEKFTAVASQFCSGCTDGRIESISRDEEGDFSYVEDGKRRSIEDASGAQKSIMGLGVQFALAMSAPCPLDIIIVDEPTSDMDAEHSLATTMMLSTAGSQVIMISHSQMDNAACENVIAL